tara:strand:- start:264 stop:746 length:483 start_codon:yes stop_codon:yes gene_type:complete
MALSSAKHEKFYETSGSGADKVSTKNLTAATNGWATEKAEGCSKYIGDPILGPLIYQLQQMQDEIDYLRTEISSNKDKATFPGFGTSGSTALAGDTALLALGTSGSTALAGDTNIVTIGSSTTIAFGDMITATVKGKTSYSIVMTVTNGGVSKSTTLTLA